DSPNQYLGKSGNPGVDQAYWTEAVLGLTDRLSVTPGMRLAYLVLDETRHLVLEPRLAARWQAGEDTAFTAATGLYRKLPDMLSGVLINGFGQPSLDAERALHMV